MPNLSLIKNLRCLFCGDISLELDAEGLMCKSCGKNYELFEKVPILLGEDLSSIEKSTEAIYDEKLLGNSFKTEADPNSLDSVFGSYMLNRIIDTHLELVSPYCHRNCKVLEIGCGKGSLASELCKLTDDVEYYGFDLSLKGLFEADKNMNYENALFFKGNALNIPFSDHYFDIVICSEVIEHIPEPEKAIREMLRVLRKGGVASVSVPNSCMILYFLELFSFLRHKGLARIKGLLRREEDWASKEDDAYDRAFLPGQFKNIFTANGFKILHYKSILFHIWRRPYIDIVNLLENINNKSFFLKLIKYYGKIDRLIIEGKKSPFKKMGTRQFLLVQK